ncbi:MAG: M3 family oligoendopeptidase [Bacteroidetes bacterium]|nr:M3 family oligoendopeptidase [Bacteroidota bacterium]
MSERQFLPKEWKITGKDDVIPYYDTLLSREISSIEALRSFLRDVSELDSAVSEDMAWRYIRMTCDTLNKEHEASYLTFVQEIQPHLAPLEDTLNKKILDCTYTAELEKEKSFAIYFRSLRGAVELFREENVPLQAELQSLAQEYSAIQGAMGITYDGKEFTMQQAGNFLLQTDRELREKIWNLMYERRNADVEKLESLFDKMLQKRHQVALNAGFKNFRDYMFKALGRYDYNVEDCYAFHSAIEKNVVPLYKNLMQKRKEQLGYTTLKPWDTSVDSLGRAPLKPFDNGTELLEKSLLCLGKIDAYFSECLEYMKGHQLLDLESRKGKAPGGYNYPLAESNVPFIFMNASGNLRDVETLVHEGGHAVHSFLMAPLEITAFKNTPSEIAELASMSMELLSMDGWDAFFENKDELQRAKMEQLEGIIGTLPWIANVDAFQHWIYENPGHTREERANKWLELSSRFGTGLIDYTGIEDAIKYSWHKQLHIFEIPFYYIEYGFAQLGAIGMWKRYTENHATGIEDYKKALKLGYTKTIPEVYAAAGLSFNFSENYVNELFGFLQKQMDVLD